MARVLAIGDLQEPFSHPKKIQYLELLKKQYNPTHVVIIGDEADFKFLKYASKNDPMSPMEQHRLAVKNLKEVYKLFPKAQVCESNHVRDRLLYAAEAGSIPSQFLKDTRDILEAPDGWEWGEKFEIDNVLYEHGHHINGGMNSCRRAVEVRHQSVVFGHHPLLEVKYQRVKGQSLFGMCVGALTVPSNGERMSWGMAYGKKYAREMPIGSGVVFDGKYAFAIPLV